MERDFTKYELQTLKEWYVDNMRHEFDNEMDFDYAYDKWLEDISWDIVDDICHPEEDEFYQED